MVRSYITEPQNPTIVINISDVTQILFFRIFNLNKFVSEIMSKSVEVPQKKSNSGINKQDKGPAMLKYFHLQPCLSQVPAVWKQT